MIILKRDDGHALNLSAAEAFFDHAEGLIVEMPNDNFYITSIVSLEGLQTMVDGRFATMITIQGHFKAWPASDRIQTTWRR